MRGRIAVDERFTGSVGVHPHSGGPPNGNNVSHTTIPSLGLLPCGEHVAQLCHHTKEPSATNTRYLG